MTLTVHRHNAGVRIHPRDVVGRGRQLLVHGETILVPNTIENAPFFVATARHRTNARIMRSGRVSASPRLCVEFSLTTASPTEVGETQRRKDAEAFLGKGKEDITVSSIGHLR